MSDNTEIGAGGDRREYFRIDDDVHLVFRALAEDEYHRDLEAPELDNGEPCSLVAQLHSLSTQSGLMLSHIRKSHPDIAQYLSVMDKKLDLIASMAEGSRYETLTPNNRVNISAGGLAFDHTDALAADTKLRLKVLFFPSYLCIHPLARVVHCERGINADAEKPYRIGLEFTRLAEAEQDALIKHMLELQSAMLRRQRSDH